MSGAAHQRQPSAEEAAGAALDEATRDLLRLSAEPTAKFLPSAGRNVQKAASASSVMRGGPGRFRLPQLFGQQREASPDTQSAAAAAAARGRRPTAPFAGLSRPAAGQPLPHSASSSSAQIRDQLDGEPGQEDGGMDGIVNGGRETLSFEDNF